MRRAGAAALCSTPASKPSPSHPPRLLYQFNQPTDRPFSFCVFNNVAVAAAHAMEAHGLERVAVVDFDVHHG